MDSFFQERAKARKYFLNILNNGDLREIGDLKRNLFKSRRAYRRAN